MNTNVTILSLSLGAFLSLLCSCATQPNGIVTAPLRPELPAEQIICDKAGEPLVVNLRLADGQDVPFMVDTGTSITTLDRSFERCLGPCLGTKRLNKPLSGVGSETVSVYPAPKLYLGNVPLITGPTILAGNITRATNHAYNAILGMDCLGHYCIQMDFAAGKMRFLDPGSLEREGLGRAYSIAEVEGAPVVNMSLPDDKSLRLMMDTGFYQFADGTLPPGLIRPAFQNRTAFGTPVFLTFTQDTANQIFLFPTMVIGGQTYKDLRFLELLVKGSRVQGFIGLRFMARHVVTFDFPKREVYLRLINEGQPETEVERIDPAEASQHGPAEANPT